MAKKVKKRKKIEKNNMKSNDNELLKLIKLVIIISIIFLMFYIITIFINKEEEVLKPKATIQYDEILMGNILNQPNDTYYVFIKDIDDSKIMVYNAYINNYLGLDDAKRVYTTTIDNPLNNQFIGDKVVIKVKDVKDLRFKETSLVKVEKGKITEYYEKDEVEDILIKLSKFEIKE